MKKLIAKILLVAMIVSTLACLTSCGNGGSNITIGENGNWWLGSSDTGIKAAAEPVTESRSGCKGAVASEALLLLLMLAAACVPTFKSKKRDSDLSVL